MKKIDIYITKVILKPFLTTLFILVGMIWLLQSIRLMDFVINKNMPVLDFLELSILMIPGMLIVLLPLSYFSGVYSGLKKMVLDSEMDAIFSSGISRIRLLKPLMVSTLFIIGLTYFISLYAMPASRIAFYELRTEINNESDSLKIEAGTFNKMSPSITVFVKEIENNQWMKNIIVYDNTHKENPITWTAEEGVLKIGDDNKSNLFLIKGTRQEINPDQTTSVLGFSTHQIDLTKDKKPAKIKKKKVSEKFVPELLDTKNLTTEKQIRKHKAELYKRLLWPLAPLSLMLIPLWFLFKPIKSRFGISRPSIYSIVAAVLFIALEMFFNSRISSGAFEFTIVAILWAFMVPVILVVMLLKEHLKK